jgi:hypothetical protein
LGSGKSAKRASTHCDLLQYLRVELLLRPDIHRAGLIVTGIIVGHKRQF